MINKENSKAKAQFFRSLINPGLETRVFDNETFAVFNPKSRILVNTLITYINK